MSHNQTPIGLIGVGLLGTALAERLLAQDFAVQGYDIDPGRRDALRDADGRACDDAAQVFGPCDIVLLSLPNSQIAKVLLADQQASLRDGQTIVDTTTGNPEEMVAIEGFLQARGVQYVEATVAGSSVQLRSGDVALFVGGEAAVVEQVQHLLAAIAPKHFHLGPVGAASRFKLVHNLVLGLHRAVLAEGLTFAQALGFDPAGVLEILKQTPAASTVMETKGKKMVSREREPEARLSQHLKDVRLIITEAQRTRAETPLSLVHRMLLERAEELGFGDADNSAVIEAFRNQVEGAH